MDDVAKAIQRGIIAKHWSRETLAHTAGIGLSTVDRIMSGARQPSFEHLIKISNALGFDVTAANQDASPPQVAPDRLGAYSRSAVSWMESRYLAIRHAFQKDGAIIAQVVAIFWDADRPCLAFARSEHFDGPIVQRGELGFSTQTGHSYLLYSEMGRFDLTILGRPSEGGRLNGVCTMTYLHRGIPTPASSATVFIPIFPDMAKPDCGMIDADHSSFPKYHENLRDSEREDFARLPRGSK